MPQLRTASPALQFECSRLLLAKGTRPKQRLLHKAPVQSLGNHKTDPLPMAQAVLPFYEPRPICNSFTARRFRYCSFVVIVCLPCLLGTGVLFACAFSLQALLPASACSRIANAGDQMYKHVPCGMLVTSTSHSLCGKIKPTQQWMSWR